jgi:cytochrome P450 family 6
VTVLSRYCSKDYKVEHTSCTIKKGQLVIIPCYAIHHDKDIFPNPEVFDPERFTMLESAKRPQVAFMPFGHGARNCIGETVW